MFKITSKNIILRWWILATQSEQKKNTRTTSTDVILVTLLLIWSSFSKAFNTSVWCFYIVLNSYLMVESFNESLKLVCENIGLEILSNTAILKNIYYEKRFSLIFFISNLIMCTLSVNTLTLNFNSNYFEEKIKI